MLRAMEFLASCLHDLTALGAGGLAALMGGLFVAGLAGGATHCAGMCGPFVMAQVAGRFAAEPKLSRLSGGALLPYHAGRMVTYAGLGAAVGLVSGIAIHGAGLRWLAALLLVLAAMLMLAQALGHLGALARGAADGGAVGRLARPLLADPRGFRGFALGLALGFLPCGLLWGALAAAAASGSALGGALAMAAFALGTVPALLGVGLLGAFFGRQYGPALRLAGAPLALVNAAVMVILAVRVVQG